MSRIIIIHRQLSFGQAAHTDPELIDWFNQAFKAISPYWKGKVVGTGLTYQEQKLLLPYVLGVESDDREFRKRVELFYHELLTKVPPQGLKLEIGLEDDSQSIGDHNLPINIQNYIIYRHAIGHPKMAMSKEEADRNPIKSFYIYDPAQVTSADIQLNTLEDQATAAYFKYKDDEVKVDQILTMLGVDIKKLGYSDKVLKLKSFTKKQDAKGDLENQSDLVRFIDICDDPDLMLKYLIQEMVGAQILERQGMTIFIKETGEAIGANAKEAVAYLKNPKNSRVYNMLRGHYESVVKKGSKNLDLPVEEVNDAEIDSQVEQLAKPRPTRKS
jgi:hypothetical protein